MPELPELIYYKEYVDSTALHQPIRSVTVNSDKVVKDTSEEDLNQKLNAKSFVSTYQHGKYLFLLTNNEYEVAMHFGMTGRPVYFRDVEDASGHPRVVFNFENNFCLAFDCSRMFGKVYLITDREKFLGEKELGTDAMSREITPDRFAALIGNNQGMIKTTLMDQSLLAGIGNEVSEEMLYQAEIHPKTKISDLTQKQFQTLYEKMHEVVEIKIKTHKGEEIPDSWILRHRKPGATCPRCGGKIERIKVGGRGTYVCPECQKP